MKKIFLIAMFLCLVVLRARGVHASRTIRIMITTRTRMALSIRASRKNMTHITSCTRCTISCIYRNIQLIARAVFKEV